MRDVVKIFALILLVAAFGPAMADDAGKEKRAAEIVAVVDQDVANGRNLASADLRANYKKEYCLNDDATEKLKKLDDAFNVQVSLERQKEFHAFLIENFSESELAEISKFYSSAAGKKYHDKFANEFVPQFLKSHHGQPFTDYWNSKTKIFHDPANSDKACVKPNLNQGK